MRFSELINKALTGNLEVYLANHDLLNTQTKLFATDFDIDDEEKREEYKNNLRKYWDYDVCWFRPQHYVRESGIIISSVKIVIEEPPKEELPF